MRTFWIAAVAVLVAGGTWWLSDRPDSQPLAERGQALAIVTIPATLSTEARAGQHLLQADPVLLGVGVVVHVMSSGSWCSGSCCW